MVLNSIRLIIADLQSKYEQIQKKDTDKAFYTKIADYGKYLLDHEEIKEVLAELYEDAQKDIERYKKAAKEFLTEWNILAKDLIEQAEKAGIKDDMKDPFNRSISELQNGLGQIEASGYTKDVDSYYRPYQFLVWRFFKEEKQDLIIPKHIDKDSNYPHLQDKYNAASEEWDSFKNHREVKTWWAHYQIERLTYGVYRLEEGKKYFQSDNIVDMLYHYEFHQVLANSSSNFVLLQRDNFNTWVEKVHKYLMPRLDAIQSTEAQREFPLHISPKLQYFLTENIAQYKGQQYSFIGKAKALLTFLNQNKGTPFTLEEIKQGCNDGLITSKQFKLDKDLADTLRTIKKNLNVKNREYFPIQKEGNKIIWSDK